MQRKVMPASDPQSWASLLLAVLLFAGAFVYAYRQNQIPKDALVVRPSRGTSGAVSTGGNPVSVTTEQIAVHVAGAVKKPGVYYLPKGSRVEAALRAAGGPAEGADPLGVNPAALLSDADQVIVPEKEDRQPPAAAVRNTSDQKQVSSSRRHGQRAPDKLRSPGEGTVNINTAALEELQRLPGVGPAIAARILAYRSEKGGFRSVDELTEVSGIGEKKLAAMKPFVRLH